MSTKDVAREKLLASMRKTKAAVEKQPETKKAAEPTPAPAPAKAQAKTTEKPRVAAGADPYQSRGRVWPD